MSDEDWKFKVRAKPVGVVQCSQLPEVPNEIIDPRARAKFRRKAVSVMVERPAFTKGDDLVVCQTIDGNPFQIIHVPSGLSACSGYHFKSVKAAAAAIEELRPLVNWKLPHEELMKAAVELQLGGKVASICLKHGAE